MDNQAHAVSSQRGARHPSNGVQILRECMGWYINRDSVFLYGVFMGNVYCTCVEYSQACEFLAPNIQLAERLSV